MRPRAIIFDFGNVLAFFDYGRVGTNFAALSTGSLTPEEITKHISEGELLEAFETGALSVSSFLQEIRTRLHLEQANDQELTAAWCDLFTPNQPVIDLIKRLPSEIPLVLGSTTNQLHFNFYRKEFAEALDRFKGFVTSFEVGKLKPDPLFYEECVKVAGCKPEECLYFDDVARYVDAANKLGIDSVVYNLAVDIAAELHQRGVRV